MTIKFSLVPNDLVNLSYDTADKKVLKKAMQMVQIMPLFFMLVYILFSFLFKRKLPDVNILLITAVFYFSWRVFSVQALKKASEMRISKSFSNPATKIIGNERTVSFGEEKLRETIRDFDGKDLTTADLTYEELKDVVLSNNGLYIFIPNSKSLVLPKRAFKDSDEIQKIYEFIKEKMSNKKDFEEIIVADNIED